MTIHSKIRAFLIEVNTCRRLWKAWNDHQPVAGDRSLTREHFSFKYRYLMEQARMSFFFRFLIRLYALMEEGDDRLSFGTWLGSLKQTLAIEQVRRKYEQILESEDFRKLREKRHNFAAHNALNPRDIEHSYRGAFDISKQLEDLYDEVVRDGQASSIPWDSEIDPHVIHPSNCEGGIEENIASFFQDLED